ncbi:MAG: flagellar biosynthesis protein FliQ [Planctomycetes bacterium]|nr:flagellar biosynthesis protein FliQ [Planctomycetota bacterium]
MEAASAIELCRQAVFTSLLIGAPLLLVGLLAGLLIGLLQAVTQVQDQTVSFVPKAVAMVVAMALSLPWLLQRMTEYTESLIRDIPQVITGG